MRLAIRNAVLRRNGNYTNACGLDKAGAAVNTRRGFRRARGPRAELSTKWHAGRVPYDKKSHARPPGRSPRVLQARGDAANAFQHRAQHVAARLRAAAQTAQQHELDEA